MTRPPSTLPVAAVQYKARRRSLSASRDALVAAVERAAAGGARLVVFPEMAATGYIFSDREAVAAVAEPATGPTFQALRQVACRHHCALVGGFAEAAGDDLYNSAWVIDPDGELVSVYRKSLLYEADLGWATCGDGSYVRFEVEGASVVVGICMDLNDDRFTAFLRADPPDVVAFPTNWVREDVPTVDVWNYWAWRLLGVPSALVAANTWGREAAPGVGPTWFTGRSAVLRDRVLLGALPAEGDGVLHVEVPVAGARDADGVDGRPNGQ